MMRFMWIMVVVCVKCSAMSRNELEEFSDFLKKTSQLDLNVKKGVDPDDIFDEDDEISDHAWEESGKFEGDLILNDRQRRLIVENVEGLSRNGLTDSTKRWPNNEVIFFIQREHFNEDQVQAIQEGIEDLGQASCVKFRPYRKGDRDAVVIQGSRRGCFSQVGYQGGYQVLNLSGRHPAGRGCFRHGTVVHELLHTLGFYHMQSSPDRDDYINVLWENILQPARHNFRKYNSFSVSDFGVGYDYDSVLHYSRRAFSSNGKDTLVPKQGGARIGQRTGLSDKDSQKLNKMYCDADTLTYDADETHKPKNKKKKPKNKPFQGHGIGYHQGKTVIIKVPTSETYKLPPNPSIVEFDFRRAPETLPSPQIEDYRVGKEITYNYNPPNEELFNKKQKLAEKPAYNEDSNRNISIENDDKHSQSDDSSSKEQIDTESEELDEDIEEAFDRLAAIAKQRVYPEKDYSYKINEDYSQYYSPPKRKRIDPSDHTESVIYYADDNGDVKSQVVNKPREDKVEKYSNGKPTKHEDVSDEVESVLYYADNNGNIKSKVNKPTGINGVKYSHYKPKPVNYEGAMNPSYRTSLPLRKPYGGNQRIGSPTYATRDYLKDRHDYSPYYSGKEEESSDSAKRQPYKVLSDEVPTTSHDEWYKNGNLKRSKQNHEPSYYTDSVENKSSSEEDEEPKLRHEENTTKSPNLNSKYQLFGNPVPTNENWYKPDYSNADYNPQSHYTEDVSESDEDYNR